MKTIIKICCGILILFGGQLFAASLGVVSERTIPKPIATIDKRNCYFQDLEEIRIALVKNDLVLYKVKCDNLLLKIIAEDVGLRNDVESLVTQEWLFYYFLNVPSVIRNRKINSLEVEKMKFLKDEIGVYDYVISSILDENTEVLAKKIKVDANKLKTLHAIYLGEAMVAYFEIKETSERIIKQLREEISRSRRVRGWPATQPEMLPDTEEIEKKGEILGMLIDTPIFSNFGREERFAEKLIAGLSKDVPRLQFYVRGVGFKTDLQCARFLERTLGRDKKTEFLFRGLPSKKAMEAAAEKEKTAKSSK